MFESKLLCQVSVTFLALKNFSEPCRCVLIDDHNGFQVSGTKVRYFLRDLVIRRNYIHVLINDH